MPSVWPNIGVGRHLMGYGDDLMATVSARALSVATGHKVHLGYWSEVFEGNPYILQVGEEAPAIKFKGHKPGNRPYLLGQHDGHMIWNPHHKPEPGDLHLSDEENEWAEAQVEDERFILVEPNVKGTVSAENKAWPFDRWQELADNIKRPLYQLKYKGFRPLEGVKFVESPSFRHACALLRHAYLFLGTDGGLHHAAAALGVNAVVLWGGYSHPCTLGYDGHLNIRADNSPPCGSLSPCDHCRDMMERIPVERVRMVIK